MARAADAHLDSVRLDVVEDNAEAKQLYERCGFAPTGRTRRYEDRPHRVSHELERAT